MRLYMLYMEKGERKLAIGSIVATPEDAANLTFPAPPPGIRYLPPEEVFDPAEYRHAIRRLEFAEREHSTTGRKQTANVANNLRKRLAQLDSGSC
jgi:hypothetical protein